jgi:hypothetical protein
MAAVNTPAAPDGEPLNIGKDTSDSQLQMRVILSKLWNEAWGRCLAPTWDCELPAIRAHSIQNSRIIDRLAEDGHVSMIKAKVHPKEFPFPSFERVGRNKATTFEGFCAGHDRDIFQRIDLGPLEAMDPEQLFLLAYRAASRELHTKMVVAYRTQGAYIKSGEMGITRRHATHELGQLATQRMLETWLLFRYRSHFDEDLVNRRFNRLHHRTIKLVCSRPTIAVSSIFAVDDPSPGAVDAPLVTFSILPVENRRTVVIFSWRIEDEQAVSAWRRRVLPSAASPKSLRRRLSRLILEKCENVVFAPSAVETFSPEERTRMLEFYISTLDVKAGSSQDLDVDLFH